MSNPNESVRVSCPSTASSTSIVTPFILKSSMSTVNNNVQPQSSMIPIGFYDDSYADAKARNVNIEQLIEEKREVEWKAFEAFAAEIENQSIKEEDMKMEERKEREAVEKLENMQYMDRYRLVLERVTTVRNHQEKKKKKKRKMDTLIVTKDVMEEEEEESNAAVMAMKEYKKKHRKLHKQQQKELMDSDDSSDLDPCNWRSRGL